MRVWGVWKEENGHIIEGEVTPCQFQIDATINLKGMEKEMAGNTAQWSDIIMEEIRLAHFHNFYNLLTINLRGMEKEVAGYIRLAHSFTTCSPLGHGERDGW